MSSKRNRIISMILSLVMVMSTVFGVLSPIKVSAADGGEGGLEISSPADGSEVNGFETIKIKWNKVTGADHYVLVVKDETTGKKIYEDELGSGTRAVNIYYDDYVFTEDGHEYKIYVAARNSSNVVLNNGSAWNAIYVDNYLELETPEIVSHSYLDTHCVDDALYVSWDPIDGADDYSVAVKKLKNDAPDYGNNNEPGTSVTYSWTDDCEIKVSTSNLVAGKWYKIALCAENTDQDISSNWTSVYILMEESSYLNVSSCDDLDSAKNSTGVFWIESNLDWDIDCDISWLTWSINQVDDTHAKVTVKATSANTGTRDREAEITISAPGVDDEYVYVCQLAPEATEPEFFDVTVSDKVTVGENIQISGTIESYPYDISVVSIEVANPAGTLGYYPFRKTSINSDSFDLTSITTKSSDGTTTYGGIKTGVVASGYVGTSYQYYSEAFDFTEPGTYKIAIRAQNEAGLIGKSIHYVEVSENPGTGILGDVNSDGKVTDMDRFILNKYLVGAAGYTASRVNSFASDIDNDGKITADDATILARHLADWTGYEDLNTFHKEVESNPVVDTSKWTMNYSANTLNIVVSLASGQPDTTKNYLFVAEDYRGLHYSGIIPAGNTSATFSIKGMQMPRGQKYTYYVVPEGIALAVAGKDNYYIGNSVVPLYGGNMITAVKSGGEKIANNGSVMVGNSITVSWDGSYGVENFTISIESNGVQIIKQVYNHSGPGSLIVDANKLSVGTVKIVGRVSAPTGSGLTDAITVWNGVVVENGEIIAIPYPGNDQSYLTYHKIVRINTDGTSSVQKENVLHDFSKIEESTRYVDEENGTHSIWKDTYEICDCGVANKISSQKTSTISGHIDKNKDYHCELCGGDVYYFTSGAVTSNYCVQYGGKEYPIVAPSFDVDKGSNYDINAGGWSTVKEQYYKTTDFDCASFIGQLELDDAGLVASGIGLFQQVLQSHDVQKLGIILQEKDENSSIRRAVILLGNNKVYTRGYTDSTIVLSSWCSSNPMLFYTVLPDDVSIGDGLEMSDWLIRTYSGLTLPTSGWADDDDYLYDVVKVYSNQWLNETFSSYLTFDSSGNATIVERIMEDDRFELYAYYDGTIAAVISNNTFIHWFTSPTIKEDMKMQLLVPAKVDASVLLSKINGEFIIKKSN